MLTDKRQYGERLRKIQVMCNLEVGGERGLVYYAYGICPSLSATQYKDPEKVLTRRILNEWRTDRGGQMKKKSFLSETTEGNSKGLSVVSMTLGGVSPTLRTRDYKEPIAICVKSNARWDLSNNQESILQK